MGINRVSERSTSNWIKRAFGPPIFEGDEDKTRTADLLNTISLALLGVVIVGLTLILVQDPSLRNWIIGGAIALLTLLVQFLLRQGNVRFASLTLSSLMWGIITYLTVTNGGVRASTFGSYVLVVAMAGLLLGKYVGFGVAGLSIAAGMGMLYAETRGVLPSYLEATPTFALIAQSAHFVLVAAMIHIALRSINNALERARYSNRELQALHETLEQRVVERTQEFEERTRELEASQRVTFAASERTSPDELLGLVVDLVRDQFDLYHAQVYLVDEERQAAVLRESTGYAGSQLLQRQHHIPLDQISLVTKVIHTGEPVLVEDVSEDPSFLPNPLLPETRTELGVPLRIGGRVFGVIDVQDRVPGRFTASTVGLFQTMADQITFLFENSDLLARVTEQTEALTVFATQLRIAADIAAQLGSILDPEQLLQQVVELMQSRFGLYHAHIYVLEEAGGAQRLIVRAGSGEVGRVLRDEGHSIPLDREKSLVARTVREQRPVLVEDTTLESDFMPNPLLPQTRSELSVPLIAGGRVLGVLDMQDDQAGRFTESDVDTFTTLAGQIAVALQNAGLFEQVEANARQAQVRFEVSQALAGAETEEQVLDVLIQQMGIYLQTRALVFTAVPGMEELTIVVRRQAVFDSGLAPLDQGMRMTVSQFPLLQDSADGKPFVSANLLDDDDVSPDIREIARTTGARSQVTWPLMAGSEYLGVIAVSSPEEGYFDAHKVHLYQTLAEQGVTALQSARLRAEIIRFDREYRTLHESLRDGVVHTDMEENILTCNPAFEKMVGYSLDELKTVPFWGLTPEEWHAMETKILQDQVLIRGYSDLYEKEYIHQDGTVFPVELTVYLVRDEAGNPAGFWAYVRDIAERKRAQAERERFALQLRTASDIAGQVNAILDPDELLSTVIPLVKERFGLYYAHVYVLDEATGELRLRAGYGEPGRIMLEQGLNIPLDHERSLVARAARSKENVVVHDVTAAPDFLPNPLLPDTKSEVAVPLLVGDQVLGVFDVQHDEVNYFTQADLDVFSTLAGQVATALQNAGLFEAQRQAEKEIQESEERFRGVFENVMMGLYRSTPDGQIIMANPALVRMLGYSSFEELARRDMEEIRSGDAQARSAFQERIEREGQIVQESVWEKRNGDPLFVRESARVVRDQAGNVLYYEGTAEDITERKQAEEELFRLGSAVEQTGDGIAVADLDGNMQYANPAWAQMHGYTVEEIQGKHLAMFHTEEQIKNEVMPFNEIVMQNGANSGEIGHVRKDGTTFPTMMTTTVLKDETGNPVGLVGTARDITVTKQLGEISRGLSQARDEDEILQIVAQASKDAGAMAASLLYIHLDVAGEPEWSEIVAAQRVGGAPFAPVGTRYPALDSLFSQVWLANRDRPMLVSDITEDERADDQVRSSLAQMDVGALVIIPLSQAGRWVGLFIFSWDEPHEFSGQEIEIYEALPALAAPPVANRRLLIEQERALTETLYRISRGLSTAGDEDRMLQVMAQPAIEAGATTTALLSVDLDETGEPEWIEMVASWSQRGEPSSLPVGSRFYLPEFPFSNLWMANPEAPQLIADLATDEQVDENFLTVLTQMGICATVIIPLTQAKRWVGILTFNWDEVHEFSEQEVEIYHALIGLGSPAVASHRAYLAEQAARTQIEDQAQRLVVLHETSRQLSQIESVDEIYAIVALQAPRVVKAERASVALLGGTGDYLEVFALQGESGAVPVGMRLPIEETAVGMAVRENKVVTVPNTADSPLIDSQGIAKQGLRSTMCAPLMVGGRAVGTLNVGSPEPNAYTEGDETMLMQMASLLASTMENRRLFEQTEALYQAGRRINEAESLREIVAAVVEAVPIPEINRAVLVMFDHDLDDEVLAMLVTSTWYSGVGTEPTPVGTYYPREIFEAVGILLSPVPLFLNDVQHDERVVDAATQDVLRQQNIRSMAVLPLWAGTRQLGALLVEGEEVHYFGNDEQDRYAALARQMAAAVDARNLFQQTQDALAQTDALYSISRGLSTATSVSEQLHILAHIAMDAGMNTANLLYIDLDQDDEPEWAEIAAYWQKDGEPPMPVGSRFYLPEFPFADLWVANSDKAQFITDVTTDERVDENTAKVMAQSGSRALSTIPLTQGGRWVGVITFGWAEAHEFSEQEIEIYNALTSLASPSVAGRRLMDNLERIVAERTEQLSTASDIAGRINAILDPEELLNQVVNQLHERFGLYHVHAYLLDEPLHELLMQAKPSEVARIMSQRELIMRAGSGDVGQALLDQRHAISLGRDQSLVARAARTRKMVAVTDTSLEPGFMPNPLLPETRSEVSVPLVAGDQVLGVLDLQDNRPDRFSQSDLDVFNTLAGQISIALQNAGYVEQVESRFRVSQALAGAQTEDEVLDAMAQVAGFYPEARVTIYTVDPDADEYIITLRRDEAFESGISSMDLGTRFTAAEYPLLEYVETNDIFLSRNLPLDERIDPATRALVEQVGYTSVAFFPVVARGEQLGLVVATSKEEGFFDERRLRLYQSLAEQGAIALYAARLYEDTQKVAERLHEVNQVKSEFMADMSHELRTPLNSIIGYAELMLMGISDVDPDVLEDIQAIYDNGRHLLQLINDVLDLSKIEAGRMELNIEDVFIESLLEELKTANAGLLVNKPVEVLVEVEDDLPSIEADRVRVSQILNNLIGNAIKFTKEGSITLRGRTDEPGWVCIEVQDTGVGMNESDLQDIFERYRQVGDVGARAKGTGLGLSITHHLVQMHGGMVDVHSKVGEGSVFTVRLPVKHSGGGWNGMGEWSE